MNANGISVRVLSSLIPVLLVVLCLQAGCGFDRLQGPLPAAPTTGFNLEDLKAIQDDTALTDDERRDLIREGVQAPEDESGDRLVEFLLNFDVP